MQIEIRDEDLKKELRRLMAASGGESAVKKAVTDIARRVKDSMGKGRTPWGEPFKPLAKLTVNARFRGGSRYTKRNATTSKFYRHMTGNHVPLNDTRTHIYSRINGVARGNQGFVGITDSANAKIGRVHQFGATIKAKRAKYLVIPVGNGFRLRKEVTIPARPFLPIRPNGAVELPREWLESLESILSMDAG